jgi:signal peptidase I
MTATGNVSSDQHNSRQRAIGRVIWRIAQVGLFIVSLYFTAPQRFGGKTEYAIVNGKSMEPTFHTGDLVVARPSDHYQVGDVVVYRIPDKKYPQAFRIVHRLKHRTPNGNFLVQGDNNEGSDAWEISTKDIVGKQAVMIPKGGVVMGRLLSPLFIGTYIGLILFWMLWTDDEDETDPNAILTGGSTYEPRPRQRVLSHS